LFSTIFSCFAGDIVIGFHLKGYAWFFPLMIALFRLLKYTSRNSLPYWIWAPWIAVVGIYLSLSDHPNSLQRSVMLLCPILIGMAVSTIPITEVLLAKFLWACRYMVIALFGMVIINTGMAISGQLPEITGLAAESMTAVLLANIFAAEYAWRHRGALIFWLGAAMLPVIALTRTAMLGALLSLPAPLAPLKIRKRIVLIACLILAGWALFYSERVQRKMFYSGHGELNEISLDNPDFRTTGRISMWNMLQPEIQKALYFGHGANAQEDFLLSHYGIRTQPHNDWLRLLFDYGYLGAGVFAICLIMQVLHAYRMAQRAAGLTKMLFQVGAICFIPFVLLMITDNVILYASFFNNLHFTIIGLAYASRATVQPARNPAYAIR